MFFQESKYVTIVKALDSLNWLHNRLPSDQGEGMEICLGYTKLTASFRIMSCASVQGRLASCHFLEPGFYANITVSIMSAQKSIDFKDSSKIMKEATKRLHE